MDLDLIVNPFENDIAIDPRRIEKPVPGLNDRALDKLLAAFNRLTRDPLPRAEARLAKAQLIISPEAGYGKSHLIGRLFQKLEGTATRINIQPFEDSETPWKSILDRIVYELKAPEKTQAHGPNPNETTQLHAFAHGVIAHLVADMVDTGLVRAKQPKAEVIKALREGRLGDLFREYCDKVASQPRRLEFNRDILRWLVQDLAKGMAGVEIAQIETRPGQGLPCWRSEKQQILFDFDGGSHWQRWLKIAERSGAYCDKHPGTKAVYLRTPELVSIPIPGRWPTIGPRIEEAKRRFLHVLPLYPDEVKLIYAAHEMHSDAVQGDIEFAAQEVLDFLRNKLNGVWERIMEPPHPEPVPPVHTLDKELRGRVRKIVMRERFLSLDDLLRQLGGPNDRDMVLATCGSVPEIAIHHSPSMVVLQWQKR